MLSALKKLDSFSKNIILVFSVSSISNFVNLLYQLCMAHAFTASNFAGLNALISAIAIFAAPWATLQLGVAKYCAQFNARGQNGDIRALLSDLTKKSLLIGAAITVLYVIFSSFFLNFLRLPSAASGYVLAGMCILMIVVPVLAGALQGLEFFRWFSLGSLLGTISKLSVSLLFVAWGFGITGALGGLLVASAVLVFIYGNALKKYIAVSNAGSCPISYKELAGYLFPVAISNLCFMFLVNSDMILARHWFSPAESGYYSLGQMVGKIFLFLPGAISMVLFPRTAGLSAKAMDTRSTLKKSLIYTGFLCILAVFLYNAAPGLVLKVLTGKVSREAIELGRLFSISMTLYTLGFVLITYFLSIKDFRFIKYLMFCTGIQCAGFMFFHKNPAQIQLVMCAVAACMLIINLMLAYRKTASVEAKKTT